jgi:hypothetical protein
MSQTRKEIHAQVAEKSTRNSMAAIQKHNDKSHVRSPNFEVSDFALVAEHCKNVQAASEVEGSAPHRECGF